MQGSRLQVSLFVLKIGTHIENLKCELVFFSIFRCVESLNCAAASVEDFETDIFGFAFDDKPSLEGISILALIFYKGKFQM